MTGLRAGLVACGLIAACRRTPDATVAPGDAGTVATLDASGAPSVQPRCVPAGGGWSVPEPVDLEMGDAIAWEHGFAVGLVHRTGGARTAAVGIAAEGAALRVVDIGPTIGDAPPPAVASRGADLLAVAYGVATRSDARELRVVNVAPTGPPRVVGTIAEARDDSLAFDVAAGMVVWDEATTGSGAHGVIRAAPLGADGHLGVARDLSPADSDADTPRIVPDGGGAFVLWIARRAEAATPLDAEPESIGEPRSHGWMEMVRVDASGAPAGPTRRLTSPAGHVAAYDARPLGAGRVLVVARDLGEAVDGSGGVLLRVSARADGADPPLAFPTDGLGRGAPSFVGGGGGAAASWLSWVDAKEAARLLPLDAAGAPAGPASPEPALDDKRLALSLSQDATRVLVVAPADAASPLQVVACAP